MSWLLKIAKVFPEGSEVRVYVSPRKNIDKLKVFTPRSRRGKVKKYLPNRKRYLVDVEGKDEEVHPKNLARPY